VHQVILEQQDLPALQDRMVNKVSQEPQVLQVS